MNVREWALPVYTILIQLVSGMFFVLWLIRTIFKTKDNEGDLDEITKIPVLIFFFTIVFGIIGSHFHLSHPLKSVLALTNLRTSWLSREIALTLLMLLFTGGLAYSLWLKRGNFLTRTILGWGAVLSGLMTVWCMAYIYLLPTQIAWDTRVTILSYYGSTLLLGVVSLFLIMLMDIGFSITQNLKSAEIKIQIFKKSIVGILITAILATIWVISANLYQISLLQDSLVESAKTSLQLMMDLYKPLVFLRFVLTGLGLTSFVSCASSVLLKKSNLVEMVGPAFFACLFLMVGEILERFLFYATHVRVGI